MQRTTCVRVRAQSSSPIDRHRAKVRELLNEIQVRRVNAEKVNQDFLTKNQMILKQIFQDEIDYMKVTFFKDEKPSSVTVSPSESIPVVESDVIMSDDYERDIAN